MKKKILLCLLTTHFVGAVNAQLPTIPAFSGFDPCVSFVGSPVNASWTGELQKLYTACPDVFVGIGTNQPRVNLDVRGTTYTHRLAIGSNPLTIGSKLFHLKANHPHPSQSNLVLFLIENHERPLFQINNQGRIWSRGITVNMDQSWPDYVFDSNYKLMDLKEVEEFINTHRHLPNIPKASTISKEGIDLGEMDRLLLEKIEELTLYLIQLQKVVSEQQEKINMFENKNN